MLILLVGLTSSGKSTAAKILEEMGFSVVCTGDVIREEVKNRGLEYNKENDVKISEWFNEHGEELVVERLSNKLKGDKMVIDGMRSPEMLEKLEEITGKGPIIINIKADVDSRFRRERKRKKFYGFTKEDMQRRDDAHMNIGTRELIEKSDYTIDNTNLTKEELKKEIKRILKDRGMKM
jgi:dephospho-CoA kinase